LSGYIEALCLFQQGLLHLQQGEYEPAAKNFSGAITRFESNEIFHFHHGLALCQLGEWDQARLAFARAWELNPQSADPAYGLALVLEAQGELKRAEQWYDQARSLAAKNSRAISPKLAGLGRKMGRKPASRKTSPPFPA
jgi:Flp pilus assembly protein TadD